MQRHEGTQVVASTPDRAEIRSFFTWVREILAHDLGRLVPALDAVAGEGDGELGALAGISAQRLRLFADLSETLGGGMGREDRILPMDLLNEQFAALEPVVQRRQAAFVLRTRPLGSSPVYGDRRWLGYAVGAYLTRLLLSAPRGAQLDLDVRQTGLCLVVSSRWHVPAAPRQSPESPEDPPPEMLPLAVADTILEAHGGRVKLIDLQDEGEAQAALGGFVITLPTGAPPENVWRSPCPNLLCTVRLQADQLAKDLSKLVNSCDNPNQEPVDAKSIDRR
jgi:hypothetical protein